ncbi:MAG: glycosyltransferase family 9 protein [Bryobacteraceae bacterium]
MTLAAKRHIFVLQAGDLRDVVLLEPLVAALSHRYPDASLTVACREEFTPIVPLFRRQPREVVPIDFDPRTVDRPSPALAGHLNSLDGLLGRRWVELFIAANRRPDWFSWYLGAKVQPRAAIRNPAGPAPRGLLRVLLAEAGLPEIAFEAPATAPESEIARIDSLAAAAGAAPAPSERWALPPGYDQMTESLLRQWSLGRGRYLVCFPFDDSPAKHPERRSWPQERLWSALLHLAHEWEMPVLLIAPEEQAPQAEAIAQCVDGASLRCWFTTPADAVLEAGLIASAAAYFGTDSGRTHVAQAFRVPGVAVHSGEQWPAYRAWAPGSISVVNPIECFGCEGDCPFTLPHCLDAIPSGPVLAALQEAIANPDAPPQVMTLRQPVSCAPGYLAGEQTAYRATLCESQDSRSRQVELLHAAAPAPRRNPLSSLWQNWHTGLWQNRHSG